MLAPLATVLILFLSCQSPQADRALAEQLARSGRSVEALALFERIVAQSPTDLEVRMWIARLQLRIGRTAEAEAGFRAVLLEKPSDIDARIGLASALTRRDQWREALAILHAVEKDTGDNADLFAALARAYRRAGEDDRTLEYYRRAMKLAPGDPDLVGGYETTLHAYGTSVGLELLDEGGASDARSARLTVALRVLPRLLFDGSVRVQTKAGVSDTLVSAGALLRINRSTNLAVRAAAGPDNASLPIRDLWAEVRHYRGQIELGSNIRHLLYSDTGVVAASAIVAWETRFRSRVATRYTFSSSGSTGESTKDHSVLVRETLRAWRRADVTVNYSYGIDNLDDLTADRLGDLAAHSLSLTLLIRLPSLTSVNTAWERQWRSNDTRVERVTVSIVQGFR